MPRTTKNFKIKLLRKFFVFGKILPHRYVYFNAYTLILEKDFRI